MHVRTFYNFEGVEVTVVSRINFKRFLSVPYHPTQVAWQHYFTVSILEDLSENHPVIMQPGEFFLEPGLSLWVHSQLVDDVF